MKRILAIIAGVGMTLGVNAITLDTSSTRYLGYWAPAVNPSNEQDALNQLLPLANNYAIGVQITIPTPPPVGQTFAAWYYRTANYQPTPANAIWAAKDNVGDASDDLDPNASYLYVVGKYGNSYNVAWYVGGLTVGDFDLMPTFGIGTAQPNGLSHKSVFNEVPSTPDGGVTAMLLGLGLTGIALLRRKVS